MLNVENLMRVIYSTGDQRIPSTLQTVNQPSETVDAAANAKAVRDVYYASEDKVDAF